jgi:6-phosphogluconolactonase (cycloisomerase 2 family)
MISSANFRSISRWILALLLCLGWQFVSAASLAAVSGAKPEGNSAANAGPVKGQTVPQFVYVTNRDSNDISAFRVESETYALRPVVGSPFATGAGPRSAAASADGRFLFVANGEAQTVSVYRIDERGALTEIVGSPFNVGGEPTELAIDHSGAHLFVAAEGREAILAFSIDAATGELRIVPGSPFRTAFVPAGMAVGNGDDFVYVSYASDHSVGVLKLNGETGVLSRPLNIRSLLARRREGSRFLPPAHNCLLPTPAPTRSRRLKSIRRMAH